LYEYHEGHVYLISDGHDVSTAAVPCKSRVVSEIEIFESSVCLLGSDASGHNVFFTTSDQLVPADTDTNLDIYDARICEPGATPANPCIAPEPPALPPCDGENCHGIPSATPSLLAPGTASFDGEGNLTPGAAAVVKVKTAAELKAEKLAKALKVCKQDKKKSKLQQCEKAARKKYGPAKAKKSNRRAN
jgi:hypothetical protein